MRFCKLIDIPFKPVNLNSIFNYDELSNVYLTDELSFDPMMIARFYKERISDCEQVNLRTGTEVKSVYKKNKEWYINFQGLDKNQLLIRTPSVINATYSGLNSINTLFNIKKINIVYEISEIAFFESIALKHIGLTIMDGSFCSTMPYGLSGINSLSSVRYTHHVKSKKNLPEFDCQKKNDNCSRNALYNCNICEFKPKSNSYKMIKQLNRYISKKVDINYLHSNFCIKTTLKNSYIDDGRETIIKKLASTPDYYSLISGKINSIYEIEEVFESA